MNFSNEQKQIFDAVALGKGNLGVEAKAGSGKTTTILEAIKAARGKVLYCAFNKRVQTECAAKITRNDVDVLTYHALGYSYLRNAWRGVRASGYTEFARVQSLVEKDTPKQIIFQTARLVTFLKNEFIKPDLKQAMDCAMRREIEVGNNVGWTVEKMAEIALKVLELSLQYPKDKNISFEDMIWVPVVLGLIKKDYDFIFSDETQDLNFPQFQMIKAAVKDGGRICFVGDSHQQIYGFRGAMFNGMKTFSEDLKARQLTLSTSYRCPKAIIRMAQTIVPDIKAADNAIEGEIKNDSIDNLSKLAKIDDVVLSRTNFPLVKHCLKLIAKKIPSYILGKDIGNNLISLIEAQDAADIPQLVEKLDAYLAAMTAKANGFHAARQLEMAQDKVESIKELSHSCLTIDELTKKINSLFQDEYGVRLPSVIFSTVHKFKGGEADNTFVIAESLSSARAKSAQDMQELLNVRYVCYTRARKTMTLLA